MNAKNKTVIKLSPQEGRVFGELKLRGSRGYIPVVRLYQVAKGTTMKQVERVPARRRQLHIGTLVKRINTKQVKFVIKPGSEPGTYRMTRR